MKNRLVQMAAGLLLIALANTTSAHIDLEQAGTHVSRYAQGARGADTKIGPCGNPEGEASGAVYTYAPGESITVSLAEYVSHPGYFRIAFDNDGDDDFMEPRWIVPGNPESREGGCPINDTDQCRTGNQVTDGDFYNNATVLMDNLNYHEADRSLPTQIYTWDVTLPDVTCENCTLQIIQVMEDPAGVFHGPFNTQNGDNNDIYHQCIDLRLR